MTMVDKRKIILKQHIKRGLEKYGSNNREDLQNHLDNKDIPYTVKEFNDKRILLIYTNSEYAILLKDESEFYDYLDEESTL